jgi:hypothetical protein
MDVVHPRCAGIDCSKRDAKVCVRIAGQDRKRGSSTVTTWGATTFQILALREHLLAEKVTCVVIESTSDCWKPFYYLLDDALDMMLVNASRLRNVPGRKTDVSDAGWLADLGAHGLVTASSVPPPAIRALRDLTRARTHITRECSREVLRLEKLLEDAGIKLSSVATDITRSIRTSDARSTDRRPDRSRGDRRSGQAHAAAQDRDLTEALVGRSMPITRSWPGCSSTASTRTVPISVASTRGSRKRWPPFASPGTVDEHSGILHQDRRGVHRRNRRGHGRVPQRGPLGFLGWSLAGLQRVRWPDQVDKDTSR